MLSHGADEPAPAASGHLLIPWPNRIDRGRYDYGGASHQLDISEPERDCAIHGLVRWAPWRVAEHEPHRVRLTHRLLGTAGYPFRLDLEAEYELDAAGGLRGRITVRNAGNATAPYGHGAHPYLTVGEPIDDCRVTLLADRYVPVDERMIPAKPSEDVTGTQYDLRLAGTPRRPGDRQRVHGAEPRRGRPGLGGAGGVRAGRPALGRRGAPLDDDLHGRERPGPPHRPRRRADDVPAERVRDR